MTESRIAKKAAKKAKKAAKKAKKAAKKALKAAIREFKGNSWLDRLVWHKGAAPTVEQAIELARLKKLT